MSGTGRTFKIFCRADEGYCVTVRNDDAVVLAPEDSRDAYQHWYKDMRHSSSVQDEEGRLAFALVNKATGLAIKHSRGQSHPVQLVPYEFDPERVDESMLWTESKDVGDGFRCIRMVNNIYLNFDAYQGEGDDEDGGHDVHDGTPVVLWEWCEGENQSWKVLPWGCDPDEVSGNIGQPSEYDACFDAPPPPPSDLEVGHRGYDDPPADEGLQTALSSERTVRVFCSADEEYSLTLRNGTVCLAPSDDGDESQHWVKDMRHSTDVKDEEGYPAFALVNKVTGEAIKHSLGQSHPVGLKWYNPDNLDESVLWTQSADVGDGFRCIRMVNNILLNFDALGGVEDSTGIHDGTELVLWEWCEGDNQRWKILPW